jgi:hypothetical protein
MRTILLKGPPLFSSSFYRSRAGSSLNRDGKLTFFAGVTQPPATFWPSVREVEKTMNNDQKDKKPKTQDERLDEGLNETFPASDPPAPVREPQPAEKRNMPDPKP